MKEIFKGLGIGVAIFLYQYVKKKVCDDPKEVLEAGETELDYVNPKEIKPKRKKPVK